ncbi:nuclear transport factor 2 family protein [Luteibacter yeojuensis]|uniref:Nuclear transport factor 2 family protein n=1 Tax=Luteibacter yeojuensis TaxID=345309 RepID=A0A7X5TRU9_9GAMM|nr:nuclear transport factor 2 family protein [Luteibacter yeojuensis]NID17224.1 nuclear transport factor 2 family protein [Luteibacter yeojuensis]
MTNPAIDPARQALIEAYIDAYNRFDIEGMLATLSDDVRFEHHSGDEVSVATDGKADLEKLARVGAAMFASRHQSVVALVEEGDTVAATIDFHGEIAEDIPDGPRAGTVVEMRGSSEFAFSGGRICRVVDKA